MHEPKNFRKIYRRITTWEIFLEVHSEIEPTTVYCHESCESHLIVPDEPVFVPVRGKRVHKIPHLYKGWIIEFDVMPLALVGKSLERSKQLLKLF